jgi:hypothetical protein
MEKTFKKVEAKFKFYKKWIDVTEQERGVTVDLYINYHHKTFSVTPENESAGKFTFLKGDANSAIMWDAILEAIRDATCFAHKELEF